MHIAGSNPSAQYMPQIVDLEAGPLGVREEPDGHAETIPFVDPSRETSNSKEKLPITRSHLSSPFVGIYFLQDFSFYP